MVIILSNCLIVIFVKLFSFKKLLGANKLVIIDIGTFKVKLMICEINKDNMKVIGYSEKRQDSRDMNSGELIDLEGICQTINDALKKASKGVIKIPKSIVINLPTSSVFNETNKITYKRNNSLSEINIDELSDIITESEKFSLNKAKSNIFKKTGFKNIEMKLITSSITKFSIDGARISNPIGLKGENVKVSLINIFTPISKFENIKNIGKFLNKEIKYIIPCEFSIPKILEKTKYEFKDVVFLDIGNSKIKIIIQKKGVIKGFKNIDIGINDLIKSISKENNESRTKIIDGLNKDLYEKQKDEFLDICIDGILLGINEVIGNKSIPTNFYLTGGGSENKFIKEFIESKKFKKHLFLDDNATIINKDAEKEFLENVDKLNISFGEGINKNKISKGVFSLLLSSKEAMNTKNDVIKDMLKKVLEKIKL